MEENRIGKALSDLAQAVSEELGKMAQQLVGAMDGILPCIRCYKFLNCWACENWLHCNERIEKAERVQCFECDGIGCQKTCRK